MSVIERTAKTVTGSKLSELASKKHHELESFDEFDDHKQYARLEGRVGGQELIGGTGATDKLLLGGTSKVGSASIVEATGTTPRLFGFGTIKANTTLESEGTLSVAGTTKLNGLLEAAGFIKYAGVETFSTGVEKNATVNITTPAFILRIGGAFAPKATLSGITIEGKTAAEGSLLVLSVEDAVNSVELLNENAESSEKDRFGFVPAGNITLKANERVLLVKERFRWRLAQVTRILTAKKPLTIAGQEIELEEGKLTNAYIKAAAEIEESKLSLPEVVKKVPEQTIEGRKNFETPQPAEVGTGTGTTANEPVKIKSGKGGNTSIATTGTGGKGGSCEWELGAGGEAASALTSSSGGAGGVFKLNAGPGTLGKNKGGGGGPITMEGGIGGNAEGAALGTIQGGGGGGITLTAGKGANLASNTEKSAGGGTSGSVTITAGSAVAGVSGEAQAGTGGTATGGGGGTVTIAAGAGGIAKQQAEGKPKEAKGGANGQYVVNQGAAGEARGAETCKGGTGQAVEFKAGAGGSAVGTELLTKTYEAAAGSAMKFNSGKGGESSGVGEKAIAGAGGTFEVTAGGGGKVSGGTVANTQGKGGSIIFKAGAAGEVGTETGRVSATGGEISFTAGEGKNTSAGGPIKFKTFKENAVVSSEVEFTAAGEIKLKGEKIGLYATAPVAQAATIKELNPATATAKECAEQGNEIRTVLKNIGVTA